MAKDPIRPTDDTARTLAKELLRGARFGALAVLDPDGGAPQASRTLVATDIDGTPVILASTLALHTRAILSDPRCSLLVGEPKKGDPLAWPRMSLACRAVRVEPETTTHSVVRRRFLSRHTKSSLYADFADFSFFRLVPERGSLNGGFGRAYKIDLNDILIHSDLNEYLRSEEESVIDQLTSLVPDAPSVLAQHFFKIKSGGWKISGVDAEGLELSRGDQLHRLQVAKSVININALIASYSSLLMSIR